MKFNRIYILIIITVLLIIYFNYHLFLKYYYYYFFNKNGFLMINNYLSESEVNNISLVINQEMGSLDHEYTWNEKYRKNLRVPL